MSYQALDHADRLELQDERKEKLYRAQMWEHPDCRDPAHPGCNQCSDEEE